MNTTNNTLQTWYIHYYNADDSTYELETFECEAEDAEHAIEQWRDADPTALLVGAFQLNWSVVVPG